MKVKYYLFPFAAVDKNEKIIIYGAGIVGKSFLEQIKLIDYCECLFIVDRNFMEIQQFSGVDVYDPHRIEKYEYDKIVIASTSYNRDMYNMLLQLGVPEKKIVRDIF